MYQFTEDCLIGISQIDEEHRQLFALINEAAALREDESTPETVRVILSHLTEYAALHFAHEEAYMQQINDPELPMQKKEHHAFVTHVEALTSQPLTDENASSVLKEILTFLVRWLYRHILSSDMMIGKMLPEDPFAFSPKYHTGIELVDKEHSRLFEIIGETNDLIHNDLLHDKFDEIIHLIDELRDYTRFHFADEEALMEEIHYPGIDAQKRAHTAFVDKLMEIDLAQMDEIDEHQQDYLNELIDFLAGWLINHILKMDKAIGAYINRTDK